MSYIRKKTIEGLKVGDSFSVSRTFTEQDMLDFAHIARDYNPVHFDEERMKKSIFGKRATNAFLTETTIGSALVKMFTSDESLVIALKKETKLMAPVFIGDSITATVTVAERIPEKRRLVCDAIVEKQDATKVVQAKFLVQIEHI